MKATFRDGTQFEGSVQEFFALRDALSGATGVPQDEPDAHWADHMAVPEGDSLKPALSLPRISDEKREAGRVTFREFTRAWVKNFMQAPAPQPDRVQLMQDLGSSRHVVAILILAYELESLQALVRDALTFYGLNDDDDYVEQVAANMIQVSHAGFPDLAGTYDYTKRWRRMS